MVLACAPILLFSLLPHVLGLYFIPTEVNFAWLIFIPLSYGYSISHPKFGWMEKTFSRAIVYYLTLVLILSGYLVIAEVFARLIPSWANMWAWVSASLSIVTIFLITRANQIIHRIVDWVYYGSERNNLDLLIQMTDTLSLILSREKLQRTLVDELASIVPLTGCALFLKNIDGAFVLQSKTGFNWSETPNLVFPGNGKLATYLKNAGSLIDNQVIHRENSLKAPTAEESMLLALQDIELWIPLVSGEKMHGLLLLGYSPHDQLFTKRDRQVWHIFAHQAGAAAHNVLLIEDLHISRNELARAHQQLLFAREQERRQIAREIHDNAVQQLLGISYQVANLKQKVDRIEMAYPQKDGKIGPGLDHLRQEILQTTSQLRDLIGELRPAGLEEFGLVSALEGFIHKLQRQGGPGTPQIEMEMDSDGVVLPEAVTICLFRVSQEAVRNALKHAQAHHIQLHLSCQGNEIMLKVQDDGCGFPLPDRLSELTHSNHYGLAGISERVAWVNGHLDIRSQPGQGTEISVQIPL
jgi:signal transduction histidine kinase